MYGNAKKNGMPRRMYLKALRATYVFIFCWYAIALSGLTVIVFEEPPVVLGVGITATWLLGLIPIFVIYFTGKPNIIVCSPAQRLYEEEYPDEQ